MDYRDCVPRFPLLPGQPDRLLAELCEVQTALAMVEYHISCWHAYPATENAPPSGRQYYAAHESLCDARGIVDSIVEELRMQVAGITSDADEKEVDE